MMPLDTRLHLACSAALACAGFATAALAGVGFWWCVSAGAGLAALGGVAKELLDLAGLGTPELRDLGADAAGTALGLLLCAIAWGVLR